MNQGDGRKHGSRTGGSGGSAGERDAGAVGTAAAFPAVRVRAHVSGARERDQRVQRGGGGVGAPGWIFAGGGLGGPAERVRVAAEAGEVLRDGASGGGGP